MSKAYKDSGIPWIGMIPSDWFSDIIGYVSSNRNVVPYSFDEENQNMRIVAEEPNNTYGN